MPAKRAATGSEASVDPLAALGAARVHWDVLVARIAAGVPAAEIAWKTYAGKSGRQCVVRAKGRNLLYFKPGVGEFLVSTALSDVGVAGLAGSSLPPRLIEAITAGPKYPEGRAARVVVRSKETLKVALTLLAIKVADVSRAKAKPTALRQKPRRPR